MKLVPAGLQLSWDRLQEENRCCGIDGQVDCHTHGNEEFPKD